MQMGENLRISQQLLIPPEKSYSPILHHNHDSLFSVAYQRNLERVTYTICDERLSGDVSDADLSRCHFRFP